MLKVIFLFLMAGGVPVAIAMAGSSLVYILVSGDLPPFAVVHRMVGGIDSFPLLAVPLMPAKTTDPTTLTCPRPPLSQPTSASAKL